MKYFDLFQMFLFHYFVTLVKIHLIIILNFLENDFQIDAKLQYRLKLKEFLLFNNAYLVSFKFDLLKLIIFPF